MKFTHSIYGVTIAVTGCLACTAISKAATLDINWTKGRITDDTDVNTQGVLLRGYSLAGSGNVSVNGVEFTAITGSGTSGPSVSDPYLSWSRIAGTPNFVPGNSAGYLAGTEGLDATYSELLKMGLSASGSGAANNTTIQFTFSNLTAGNTYIIQFWTNNSRESLSGATDLVFANAEDTTNSISASRNQDQSVGSLGYWVTGIFTAESDLARINVTGNRWMNLNAIQLREFSSPIPEPVSSTLTILAGVGLFTRRRRS